MILTEAAYEELLRTGAWGPLHLGADRAAVLSSLGSPDDVGHGMARTTIWAYDSKHLQVTFVADKLVHFGLYFRDVSQTVSVPNLALSARTSLPDILIWMRDAGIDWTEHAAQGGIQARFSNGLVALFEDGTLKSLQVS